jgi:hypothetical protein
MTSKSSYLPLFIVPILVVSGFTYWKDRKKLEGQMAEMREALLDTTRLRQAAWEAQHPCGLPILYAANAPQEFPMADSEWCKERAQEQANTQAALDAQARRIPVETMMECVYDYDGKRQPIDTVENPAVHDSWVLGGMCEELAHKLRDLTLEGEGPEQGGLCSDFKDDDLQAAWSCQAEMEHWIEDYCLHAKDDAGLRQCLKRS